MDRTDYVGAAFPHSLATKGKGWAEIVAWFRGLQMSRFHSHYRCHGAQHPQP